jgi:hypothetical protein
LLELAARVGGREKELDGASGKGGSLAGLSEVRKCLDGSDGSVSLFLAETVNRVSICLSYQDFWKKNTYRASATAARRAMRTGWVYIADDFD